MAPLLLPVALPRPANALRHVGGAGAAFIPLNSPLMQLPGMGGADGADADAYSPEWSGLPKGLSSLTALGLMLRADEEISVRS